MEAPRLTFHLQVPVCVVYRDVCVCVCVCARARDLMKPIAPVADLLILRYACAGTKYDHLTAIFGRAFMELLASQRVFLVGAGALGCEFLKNFGTRILPVHFESARWVFVCSAFTLSSCCIACSHDGHVNWPQWLNLGDGYGPNRAVQLESPVLVSKCERWPSKVCHGCCCCPCYES